MGTGDSDSPVEPPPNLPGKWEGSGDVPDVLRSPEGPSEPSVAVAVPDSEWLRSLKLPDLPIRWDPAVLRYLEYFRNDVRGRAVMTYWLRRAGRFRALIESTLEREGLPKDLLYVAMVESGFETGARSRVGAGGIWQFMPGAGRAYGLEVGYWVDARRDPERSVEAAARYLKDLYVRFGSWHLVFAAYNAGYGAVLKSITRYNTNDYWELCRHEAGLPWESSLYVPKILAASIVGHNLQAFGFADVVPDPPFSFERVEVPAGTTLATVARAAKSKPETIASLNPQLARDRTPPDRGNFVVRVPVGTKAVFAEAFEAARGPSDRLETITLRFGETLDAIAKTRGINVRELRRLNGVKDSTELRAGVAIVVPRKKGTPGSASKEKEPGRESSTDATPDPAASGETAAPDGFDEDDILVAVPDRVFNYEGRERVFYRTRDADALEEIAEVFGVKIDDLVEWNNLDVAARLHPKMVLQIFVRKDFDPREVVLLDPAHVHVVTLGSQEFLELEAARRGKKRLVVEARAGDTLVKVGRRYGLTVGDLARINRFSYNTELQGGQKIVVYSPTGEPSREMAHGLAADPRRDRGTAILPRPPSNGGASSKSAEKVASREREGSEGSPSKSTTGKGSSGATGKAPITRSGNAASPSASRATPTSRVGSKSSEKVTGEKPRSSDRKAETSEKSSAQKANAKVTAKATNAKSK